jgi:hypothetical protein
MALESNQSLAEMSIRNISWGVKGGRCVRLTTLPSSCAECHEIWEPQPPGTLRACPTCTGIALPLRSYQYVNCLTSILARQLRFGE